MIDWELEIRKRYEQALASETGEFPDAESIHARMIPICYEESVVNGASFPCAAFMAVATENFIKGFLSSIFARTRLNGPSGTINGTMTQKYRRQLEQEELAFTRGDLVKNTVNGMLPVEAKEASGRQALGLRDIKLTLDLDGTLLGHMPLVVDQIMGEYLEEELEFERQEYFRTKPGGLDGRDQVSVMDGIDPEDALCEWEGGSYAAREQLGSVLDECLSMAG
jgi:transcriptional coactivator HFI1/ADA1